MKYGTVLEYTDELNDDFSTIKLKKRKIDEHYRYIHTSYLWRIAEIFIYYIIVAPISYIACKLKYHITIKNRKILKLFKKKGYFIFANHTQLIADGMIPLLAVYPKKEYIITLCDSVSFKGLGWMLEMIGCMPIPNPQTLTASKAFLDAVEKRMVNHSAVIVYPEAHVWPYYNKIRNFKSVSFKYPVKYNDVSFCMTTCYKKRKFSKLPKIVVYIDGPFYPDMTLNIKQQQEKLRNDIYQTMIKRSQESTYEYVHYVKKENVDD